MVVGGGRLSQSYGGDFTQRSHSIRLPRICARVCGSCNPASHCLLSSHHHHSVALRRGGNMPRKAVKAKEGEPQPADAAQEEPAPAPAAPAAPAATLTEAEVDELPKAIVRRLVKDKLSQVAGGEGAEVIVNKDAMVAFAESARIFIHYLSATANDMCKESKRQTISADDVLKALDEMEFSEFVEPLRTSLQEFRNKNADKRSEANKKQQEKRRKLNEETLPQKENDPAGDAKENDE